MQQAATANHRTVVDFVYALIMALCLIDEKEEEEEAWFVLEKQSSD